MIKPFLSHAFSPLKLLPLSSFFLLPAAAQLAVEECLEINIQANEALLSWEGGAQLLSSTDLITFTPVTGATSPHRFNLTGSDRMFFSLEVSPPVEPEILLPLDGTTVGTELVNVEGRVGAFSGTPGLSVTVSGQAATLFTTASGEARFLLEDLDLSPGVNQVPVVFSSPTGTLFSETLNLTYDPVDANNLVVAGGFTYAAQGADGVAIVNLETRERTLLTVGNFIPPADDVAFDGTFLFLLNTASNTNALSVYSLSDPAAPVLVSGPVAGPTSFFSGVSAANGRVVVSGGVQNLTVREYDPQTGVLSNTSTSIDLGIGQPDVLLSPDGSLAYVSVDYSGFRNGFTFGISALSLNSPPTPSVLNTEFGVSNISGLGLNDGGQAPANFPLETALLGDQLLVTSLNEIDVLNPSATSLEASVPVGFFTVNVDAVGSSAFVVGSDNGVPALAEIDFSTPSAPSVSTRTFPGGGLFTGVAATATHIAIAGNAGGLRVLRR